MGQAGRGPPALWLVQLDADELFAGGTGFGPSYIKSFLGAVQGQRQHSAVGTDVVLVG